MVREPLKLLLIEDSEDDAVLLCDALTRSGRRPLLHRRVSSAAQLIAALNEAEWDVVIGDHAIPDFSSIEALRALRAAGKDVPLIVYSGATQEQLAISALQEGANDCIQKGNVHRLLSAIERELRYAEVLRARNQAESHLHRLAYYDDMTGLPNRNYFCEQVNAALQRQPAGAAVIYVDLDRFMRLNNTFGYAVGDALMRQVAERLRHCVAEAGLLARFRGDEFGIFLETADPVEVKGLAERITAEFQRPFVHETLEFFVTVSMGISCHPADGDDAQTLLMNAAIAMSLAKDLWRSNYKVFVKSMGEANSRKLVLESALRHAIQRNELFLHLQPIVDLQAGGISGCEALVRWRHPEFGLIGPDTFIPLADESGFIIELGDWVLREACRQVRKLHLAGYGWLSLSVNVSAVQFAQPQLLNQISSALAETGFPPEALTIEITESVLMQDAQLAIGTLRALKEKGIKIAVDDFGTGYSSLAYLRRFTIDVLKIDKSFIQDLSSDADNEAIVSAIAVLARSLKLGVVAEGVETGEQLELVRQIGCDRMQGYYYSRPIEAGAFSGLLADEYPRVRAPKGTRTDFGLGRTLAAC